MNLAVHTGNTLVRLASYNGNVETTRTLLKHGAQVDRRNDRGRTPLGGVAFRGCDEIVALLLQHGADIEADNGGDMTPVMFGAMFGRAQVVEQLKAHGASLLRRNRLGIPASMMVRLRKQTQPANSVSELQPLRISDLPSS